ncbi:MAG: type II toxin-antitoxin system PemK/MazF family toxin [Clostridia bacterium]|nr:type II toxin-antitoxin system PemK/MazF family toxin [Clostridia bacterium]
MEVIRGDIFIANLDPVVGSEQGGVRPVLVLQNDRGNRFSPTVICAAMTSKLGKSDLPTHVWIAAKDSGLSRDSLVLCEQIRTLEKSRLRARAGRIDGLAMERVNRAVCAALALESKTNTGGRA